MTLADLNTRLGFLFSGMTCLNRCLVSGALQLPSPQTRAWLDDDDSSNHRRRLVMETNWWTLDSSISLPPYLSVISCVNFLKAENNVLYIYLIKNYVKHWRNSFLFYFTWKERFLNCMKVRQNENSSGCLVEEIGNLKTIYQRSCAWKTT